MSSTELTGITLAFLIIIVVTIPAHFGWMREGSRITSIVLFIAGAAVIGSLRTANVPPDWFDGSKTGFGLALMFFAWAFVTDEGRWFGVPLLTGSGATLLVLNITARINYHL